MSTGAESAALRDAWPKLPHSEWRPTLDTLHMYTQVLGKLRLALSPFEPVWANVPLYVSARGLTTSPVPYGLRAFEVELDLIDHRLMLRDNDGHTERFPLGAAVADFYRDLMSALARIDVNIELSTMPSEVSNPIPFPDDRTHDTYDFAHASLFHRVLAMIDVVTKEHRANYQGWSSPVHFFWGTFDLALTRFSGRRVPPPQAGAIERYGGTHELIACGWWPGEESVPVASFYAYGHPAPEGIAEASISPPAAGWDAGISEFLLRYDAARETPDPRRAILDFYESTYAAAARLMGYDPELTNVFAPPPNASLPRGLGYHHPRLAAPFQPSVPRARDPSR